MNIEEHDSGSVVLTDIPFEISEERVYEALNLRRRNPSVERAVNGLVEEVRPRACPKALYRLSYVEKRTEDTLTVAGVEFRSRILRMNTEKAERIFPYVITAGRELDEIETSKDDYMRFFCLDVIKEIILEAAVGFFEEHVSKTYALGPSAHMNPGSLADWPISEQPKLFSIFADAAALVGVSLTESCLMNPIKSVSGIYFPTEVNFRSCMLCPRHACSKRKAEYDPQMIAKYR